MISGYGVPFNEEGFAALVADVRRLALLVGGGSNDLNQTSQEVTQEATQAGENAANATKIRGTNVSTAPPSDQASLLFSKARNQWEPSNAGSSGGTALLSTNNLSDLQSASTARTNLGLGSAALLTTTGVLLPANNLSDVASTSNAKDNLGLGTGNAPTFNALSLTANLVVGSGTQMGGGISLATRTQASSGSLTAADTVVITSGGTITFQSAATTAGRLVLIMTDNAGGTPLSASGAGQTINAVTGFTTTANSMQLFVSNGISNWYRII